MVPDSRRRLMRLDDRQRAGLFLFVGIAQFAVIGLTVSEAVYSEASPTGYSISQNYISDLGVGPAALIFNPSIILVGVLVLATSWFLWRAVGDRILSIVVALAGAGAIAVGVFTEAFGVVHELVSLWTFIFIGLSAILAARIVRPPFRYISVILGVLSLVALGLYIAKAYLGLGNRLRRVPVRLVVSGVGLPRGTLRPRMQNLLDLPSIEAARKRIEGLVVRTPLVRLNVDDAPAEIYLKLENLQPTGSFKVRGAGNSIALLTPEQRSHGVFTCSAGNMAQALAWHARRLGIPCTAIVPDTAPATKLAAIRRFGATIVQLSWDEVWEIGIGRTYAPLKGWTFVHPFADATMMAGNGTIGLEILEDLPDPDAVIIPFGGGGLSAGIATAIKAKRPRTRIYACEPETAAPLAASFAKSAPTEVHRIPTFVDGIGTSTVLPEMWNIVRPLLEGSLVVTLKEIASAIRLLVERNRVVAEGAGGSSVAAALAGKAGKGRLVCVVSGGNIDTQVLGKILRGEVP